MDQPVPSENNQPPQSKQGISQQVENSTLYGGMQAVQGDSNIQAQQTVTGTEYAATSATGDATVIINYYYREDTKVAPVDSPDAAANENLPCPYRGLFHFGPDDAEFFFGRGVFVEELFQATQTRNFIPVLGASGSGKSSVVLAGLVPKLQQEGHWKFTHFRPGVVRKKELRSIVDPFYALATALVPLYTPHLDKTKQLAQASDLADFLRDGKILLSDVIAAIQQNYPNHRVLLIADQFEELYTLCHEENIRRHFLDILIDNIYSPIFQSQSPLVLVLAMRADFLGNALSYRPFADVLRNADIKLGSMNRQELSQVIEKPAEKLGVKFEVGLVDRILDDVEDEPGNLPLLEFALTLLWQRRTGKQLNHAAYDAIGQVEGALANYADDKYGHLIPAEQEQTRRILIQLVRPGEGTEDTRRLATKEELGEKNWFLVQQLADARLIVTSRNAAGQETAEVVHEALIQNWGKLRQWMETDRDFRAWQERLRTALRQWEETKRDEGALLRGVVLVAAEEWLRKRPVDLSLTEQEYIRRSAEVRDHLLQEEEESRQRELEVARKIAEESEARRTAEEKARQEAERRVEEQAKANKHLRRRAVALGVLLLIAVSTGGIALVSEQQSVQREWLARNNAYTSSLNLASQYLEKSQIKQFFDLMGTVEPIAGQKDLRGFEWYYLWKLANREQFLLKGHEGEVTSAKFSPNGRMVATGSVDGTIKLWNTSTGEELATYKDHGLREVYSLAFSPNGEMLAVGGLVRESVKLLNIKSGKVEKEYPLNIIQRPYKFEDNYIHSIHFTQDGKRLALVTKPWRGYPEFIYFSPRGWKGILIDVESGKLINSFDAQVTDTSMEFSMDSNMLAIGKDDQIHLVDVSKNKELSHILNPDRESSYSLAFSPNSEMLAMGGIEVFIQNLRRKEFPQKLGTHNNQKILNFTFSSDSKLIASSGNDRSVKVWNTDTRRELGVIKGHTDIVSSISFSHDNKKIITTSTDNTAKIWNIEIFTNPTLIHGDSFIVSPSGKYMVVWDSGESYTHTGFSDSQTEPVLVDAFAGKELISLKNLNYVVFLRDEKILATINKKEGIQLLNPETGQNLTANLKLDKKEQGNVNSVAMAPNSGTLAVGGVGFIKLWNTNNWQQLPPISVDKGTVSYLKFSPNEQILAAVIDSDDKKIIQIWSTNNWLQKKTISVKTETLSLIRSAPFYFSPDGKTLIANSTNGVELWTTDTWKSQILPDIGARIQAFSPDSSKLLTTNEKKVHSTVLWDVKKRKASKLFELKGYTGTVLSAVFSPDGKTLVTGSNDGIVKFWSVVTGQELLTLPESLDAVVSLGFLPDGQTLITGYGTDSKRSTRLWQSAQKEEVWAKELETLDRNRFKLGKERAQQGKIEEAVVQFSGIKIPEDNVNLDFKKLARWFAVQAFLENGRTLAQERKIKEAVAKFQAALELNPNLNINPATEAKQSVMLFHRPLIAEGEKHIKQGLDERSDRKHALAEFTRGIELIAPLVAQGYPPPPKLLEAYLSRGLIYFVQQGEYQKAITDWQAATKIKPDDSRAYNNLGFAYYELNQLDKAITEWQTAVKVNPQESEIWAGLGIAFYDQGQTQEAIAAYQKALKIESNFSSTAWLRDSQSWSEKSVRSAAKLLQIMPKTSKD